MMRKKSNDQKEQNPSQETLDTAKDSTFTEPEDPLSPQSSIDDLKVKFQHLRTLNFLIVKKVFESRQQIESLVQDKLALETELSEKKSLEAEESEKKVSFESQNETNSVHEIRVLEKKVNELMGSLENEKEMLEKKFVKDFGEMEVEYDRLVSEKDELEKVKNSMVKDKDLLEKNMKCKAEEVEHLRRENEKIVREKKGIEIEKNEQRLKIDEMQKEMSGMNEIILSLRKEDEISRSKIEELSGDKIELEKAKFNGENEIVELNTEVFELRNVVHRLQDECFNNQTENNDLVDRVTLDRDNALKRLDEEKRNSVNLISKVSDMQNMLEETSKEFARKRNECQRALTMLKNTASMLCQSMDDKDTKSTEEEQNFEPYATELEAIKRVFKNKETMAQGLEQKVKFMEISMVETEKKRIFWIMVSSITTLFAAVCMAYAATGR